MKKFYLVLLGVAALSFATLSCSKEANDPAVQEETQKEEEVVEEPAQEEGAVPEGMVRLSFGVSHENDAAQADKEDTKTSWDGTTHSWSDGDQIRIIWGEGDNYVVAEVVAGKVSAVVGDAEYYYAVYPATATYTYTAAEGKISVSFGRNQSGTFADANIMAAKTSKAAASFIFKNMTSILKFTTGASAAYTKVTFAANDKTKLNGTVSTTFGETFSVSNTPALTNPDLISVNVAASNTYYVAVLPGAVLNYGIGFKVEASNQDTGALSTGSLTMARSAVKNLGTLDNNIHKDWFITENGSGNKTGVDWENAGDAARLVQLIYPTQSRGEGAGLTAAYRLHKATIHVAAGTYNIQAANGDAVLDPHYNTGALDFTIKGGYPTDLSGTATTGYDPATNKTNFICNQTAAADRVFQLSGSNKIPKITFDGITFPANGASLAPGTAFDFNSSAASNINFKNCYFTGFVQSGTVNGGPVYVQSTGAANISFTGCTFSGNTSNTGGAMYLYNDNTIVGLTDCTFSDNLSDGSAHAGAIRARAFSSLTISGGSFSNNSAGGGRGGAIYVDSGTTFSIDGTTFTNNTAPGNRAGAIDLASTAAAEIKNATFTGNSASNGGAIHTESSANLTLKNCTFSNNSATNGGAIRTDSGTTISVEGGSFNGNSATNGGAADNVGTLIVKSNCTFENNSATSGGVLRNNQGLAELYDCTFTGNSASSLGSAVYAVGASGKIAKTVVFNSLFEGNESTPTDGSGSSQKGCTLLSDKYSYMLAANSTFKGNIEHSQSHGVISPKDNTSDIVYIVSCTFSGNLYSDGSTTSAGPDIARTTSYIKVYNSISTNTSATIANVVVQNSIFTLRRFKENRSSYETMDAFSLGAFSNGVYPLNATYSSDYGEGMAVSALQGLTFDSNITLTDDQLALLAKDQKGNDRTGTIMGAYVLTE